MNARAPQVPRAVLSAPVRHLPAGKDFKLCARPFAAHRSPSRGLIQRMWAISSTFSPPVSHRRLHNARVARRGGGRAGLMRISHPGQGGQAADGNFLACNKKTKAKKASGEEEERREGAEEGEYKI